MDLIWKLVLLAESLIISLKLDGHLELSWNECFWPYFIVMGPILIAFLARFYIHLFLAICCEKKTTVADLHILAVGIFNIIEHVALSVEITEP